MTIITKLGTDNYTYPAPYQTGMFYSSNINYDRAAGFSTSSVFIPHASGIGTIDASGFANTTFINAVVGNRVVSTYDNTGLSIQFTNDLTSVIDQIGAIPCTISSQGPYSKTFTYKSVIYTLGGISPILDAAAVVKSPAGFLLLYGATTSPSVTHPDVFAYSIAIGGSAIVLKAFQMPIDVLSLRPTASTCILGTIPYLSGASQRYISLVQVLSGGSYQHYRVDWAPTSISNDTYDAVSTQITLSNSADDVIFSTSYSTPCNALSSSYGFFVSICDNTSDTIKMLQFDPQLEYYREITVSGLPQTAGNPFAMMPNDEGILQILDSNPRLYTPNLDSPPLTMEVPRVRAWGFSLDDHDMYAINLNDDETLLYDCETKQWCSWYGGDLPYWRANYGVNWQGISQATVAAGTVSDVIVGDSETGILWVLDPTQGYDDTPDGLSQDAINSVFITGIPTRGDKTLKVDKVFLSMETGFPGISPGVVSLSTSDDNGQTFNFEDAITLTNGDTNQIIQWNSLGAINAPGKLFQFSDNGASVRIDGCDINIRGVDQ